MSQQKINYIVMAGLCVLALILGYFGISLPVTPEIPAPLPSPTPVDLSGYVAHEELALVQRQLETLSVTGDATSFGAYQTDCRMEQGGDQWTAAEGCVWEVQSGATLDVQDGATVNLPGVTQGNTTVTGTFHVTGTTTLSGLFRPGFADVTITDGDILTPTKTAYALDSAGAVTLTLAASAAEGQLLFLMGDDANTITIADTNIRSSDGNAITVGQYDTVAFVYQDSEWLELLKSANQ